VKLSTLPKRFRNQEGFTFVETLITFSIVGIFLALTWATVNFLLVKTNEQIVRTRGHFLAVEGIEIVKQIRQTAVNRDRELGFLSAIKDGSYVLTKEGDEFKLTEDSNQQIEVAEEPYTIYCRTIKIEETGKSVRQVLAEVRWGDATDCSKGEEMISYSTYLADLTHDSQL